MAAIEMPNFIRSRKFDLLHAQQLSPSGEFGFIQTMRRTSPFWMAEYTTGPLTETQWQEWTYFFDQLEGSMYTFLAYDPRRPMPYFYRTQPLGNDPWTQAGQVAPRVTAQDFTNSTLTLDRLATGALISRGDYISVKVGNIWYLFRSQTQLTVVGSGATISVKPRPQIMSLVASDIRYRRASCEMKMLGRPEEEDTVDSLPSYRFRAGQYTARVPT